MPVIDANRAIYQFECAAGELMVVSLDGSEEMSRPFRFTVALASKDRELQPEAVVGKPCKLTIVLLSAAGSPGRGDDPGAARFISGMVSRFEHLRDGTSYSQYIAEIVPRAWAMNFRSNSRIFQEMDTPTILKKVFEAAGLAANMYRMALAKTYPKRDYCVQYRESDWNFAQRLMEEEGIFYSFEHKADGDVLTLGDSPAALAPISGNPSVIYREPSGQEPGEDFIYEFRIGNQIRTGLASLRDFEFTQPVPPPEAAKGGQANVELEAYEYPSQYITNSGEDKKRAADLKGLADVRVEEHQALRTVGRGLSTCRRLAVGQTFKLAEHTRASANQEYLIIAQTIRGSQSESLQNQLGWGDASPGGPNHMVEFQCIPKKNPFRPARATRKPLIHGGQTAIVVGPKGEEVHTDKHGRVKVHFHWDRVGKFDEKASCWVRVSQGWAGGQYGSIFLPRLGQEVIVSFLEGDPDQPIITGRVYNGDHMPPYPLPDRKTVSTIRTNSSLKGGGAHELRFEDMKGKEQIFLHSEKDFHLRVKNDHITNIENDSHETIANERRQLIKGKHSRKVVGSEAVEIGGACDIVVKSDVQEDFKTNENKKVGQNSYLKAGMNIVIEAGMKLTLKGPGGFITIDPSGVAIVGTMVLINSGGAPGVATPPQPAAPAKPLEADKQVFGKDHPY